MSTPKFSKEELNDAIQVLVKAQDIQNNTDLWKELEPALKDHINASKKAMSLKDLWKHAYHDALKREDEEASVREDYYGEKVAEAKAETDKSDKDDGIEVAAKDEPQIPSNR